MILAKRQHRSSPLHYDDAKFHHLLHNDTNCSGVSSSAFASYSASLKSVGRQSMDGGNVLSLRIRPHFPMLLPINTFESYKHYIKTTVFVVCRMPLMGSDFTGEGGRGRGGGATKS